MSGKQMTSIHDLDTPALLVDADKLERNIQYAAEIARAGGKRFRPHTKTHKTAEIARMQLAAGATGLTVAKLGEAEVFADAGMDDFFIANEIVGRIKLERLAELAKRCQLRVGADSIDVVQGYADVTRAAGIVLDVMIEVDTGLGRAGTRSIAETVDIARKIESEPSLRLRGIFTHEGHLYQVAAEERAAAVGKVIAILESHKQAVETAGIGVDVISVGSTPGQELMGQQALPTELRPGNSVFYDRMQVRNGRGLDDCALTVLATVVSVRNDGRVLIDAGTKTLAGDRLPDGSYGEIIGRSDLQFVGASEEHGHLQADGGNPGLRVGDKVQVVPNHACTCVNLHETMQIVRGESVLEAWRIIGRGKIQ